MYFASVGDAADLSDLGDRIRSAGEQIVSTATQQGEQIVSDVRQEGERLVSDTFSAIVPQKTPMGGGGTVAAARAVPGVSPQMTALARMRGTPMPNLQRVPLPAVTDQPTPMRPAPFRAPSTMVSAPSPVVPGLEVAPGPYAPQTDLRFQSAPGPQAEPAGVGGGNTMLLLGAAALGAFFLLRK